MTFHVMSWLAGATPVWLSLCLIAALGGVFWQLRQMMKRMDRHGESIAHMDEWADTVEETISQLEDRSRRGPPSISSAPRSTIDLKRWWQK
ncbi:hypothetical protein [Aestuariivirga sp.]|uniref:hypothetical protein n=1 Tax=Aestuariivirga sp. TaxID=2650926 RepID=UPI003BAB3E2A